MNKRVGISLITLIITIVVLIILSGGVILVLNNTGVISSSKETKFKTDLKSYDEEIRLNIGSEYTHDSSVVKKIITKKDEIEKYCKGLANSEHMKYSYISEGVLTLRGNKITDKQRKWAEEAKIKIDNGEEIIISSSDIITNLSETNWTKNDVILTIEGLKDESVILHDTPYSFDNGVTWVAENSKTYSQNTSGIYIKVRDEYEYVYTNPEIVIENIDKTSPTEPQEISVIAGLNTLTVMASGSMDNESGMEGYKYSIDGYNWTETVPENETYVFEGIHPSTSVTVYAKAVDKVGNESLGAKEINTSTLEPNSNITITLSTEDWTKGPISATISCDNIPTNYVLQYKLSEDEFYTTGSIISTISANTIIHARLYYEEIGSEIVKTQKEVKNIDDKAPSKPTGITIEESGVNTITVKAYGSVDNESGMSGYQYSLDGISWSSTISVGDKYTIGSIKSSTGVTIYARAVDRVGNISSDKDGLTNVDTSTNAIPGQVAITLEYIDGVSTYTDSQNKKWTKKINVRLYHGEIPDGYVLQYKLSSGNPTTFTTIANNETITLENNTTVTAILYNPALQDEVSSTQNTKNITIIDNEAPSTTTGITIVTQNATSLVVKASGSVDTGVGLAGYQYSINGTNWSDTISSETNYTISGLTTGTSYTVYARAVDYLNNISENYTKSTRTLYTYTVSYYSNTSSSVSNMPVDQTKIENINITLSEEIPTRIGYDFEGWATSSDGNVIYQPGAEYTSDSPLTLYAVWQLLNVAPTEPTALLKSRSTDNFVVKANATDSNGDNLTYKLYVKKSSASSYTLASTSASTASGVEVILTASNLSSYTIYNYYVTVTDTKNASNNSTVNTTGTACSGTGLICKNDGSVNSVSLKDCTGTLRTFCSTSAGGPACDMSYCSVCSDYYQYITYYCSSHGYVGSYVNGHKWGCPYKDNGGIPTCKRKDFVCSEHGRCSANICNLSSTLNNIHICYGTITCMEGSYTGSGSYRPAPDASIPTANFYCEKHDVDYRYIGSSSSSTNPGHSANCGHGITSTHYYCSKHDYVGTESQHNYCVHDETGVHYPN